MNDNTNKISNILPQIQLLKDKYDELAAVTGEHFNVFSILRIKRKEVITHTPMLAELLNPHGSHHQGAAFLKLFLERCIEAQEYTNPETFRVRSEERTDQGQFDILLEKEKEACIVIENKIDAEDQVSQLNRYYQDARKRFPDNQIKLIYLTLDGSAPDEKSLKAVNGQGRDVSVDDVIRISYREDIIHWLEECMKLQEIQRISSIREIVFQYRDLLKQLTGQSINRRYSMELKDILAKDKNYELIPELEEMILAFKVHVQFKFWGDMKTQLLELHEVRCGHKTQDREPSEDNIRHFYLGSRNRYVTQTFYLEAVNWNSYDIVLEAGADFGKNIFFGFLLFENGKHVRDCLDEKFDALAGMLSNGFDRNNRNNWRIGRKDLTPNLKFPVEYPDAITESLLDDDERGKLVKNFVEEIKEAIRQLKKNLTGSRGSDQYNSM